MRLVKNNKTFFIFVVLCVFLPLVTAAGSTPPADEDIHTAIQKGETAKVKSLLSGNPKLLNQKDQNGRTPLHNAALAGHLPVVQLLLQQNAGVDSVTPFGSSPLHYAVLSGKTQIASLLVDKGAGVDRQNLFQMTPLRLAVSRGIAPMVDLLLSKGANIKLGGGDGITLLHDAASGGNAGIVKKLLTAGMDVNAVNRFGQTPLHLAASAGHKEAAALLLKKGANIDARALDHRTPLHAAANQHPEVVKLLETSGADKTPWRFPTLRGDYLGQKAPGATPQLFAPGIVSTGGYEFAGTFSPDGNEFYFTRRGGDQKLPTNTIMVSRRVDNQWTEPQIAPFSGKVFDYEPYITHDGKHLYFGSKRPLIPGEKAGEMHQWVLEKTAAGWSEPRPLGSPFREIFAMYPTLAENGNLYYTGMNKNNSFVLCVAQKKQGAYAPPTELSKEKINIFSYIAHPFIAPDEGFLLFDANPGASSAFYISYKRGPEWSKAQKLPPSINTGKDLMCISLSPDGKYLFFTREGNIYWIDAAILKQAAPK